MSTSWVWFSILSVVVFAFVNITDKYLLVWYAKSTTVAIQILSIFSLVLAFLLYIVNPGRVTFDATLLYPLVGGVFEIVYIYYYLKAIEKDEVAYMVPLFSLAPLVALGLEAILLRRYPSIIPTLGVLVVIVGVTLFHTSRYGVRRMRQNVYVWFMVAAAVLYGIYGVIINASLDHTTFYNVVVWSRAGIFLGMWPILLLNKTVPLKGLNISKSSIFVISELLYFVALWLFLEALKRGNLVYVMGIENIQPLFVFLISYVLYLFHRSQVLKEEFSFKNKLVALVSIIIIVIGTTMISL